MNASTPMAEPAEQPLPEIESPIPSPDDSRVWGSDMVAEAIRNIGIEYVALNPGASFRGLHDSLVNHNGNRKPQMLLCLHEENAVSLRTDRLPRSPHDHSQPMKEHHG